MARVKRGVTAKARHKKILDQAKGYYNARRKVFRAAKQAVIKAGQYAFRDRRVRKREFRALWITRINAAARANGLSYSRLMNGLALAKIESIARSWPTSRCTTKKASRRSSPPRRRPSQAPNPRTSMGARGERRRGTAGEGRSAVSAAEDLAALDAVRVQFLGKKGLFTAQLREVGKLPPEQIPAAGKAINTPRTRSRRPSKRDARPSKHATSKRSSRRRRST